MSTRPHRLSGVLENNSSSTHARKMNSVPSPPSLFERDSRQKSCSYVNGLVPLSTVTTQKIRSVKGNERSAQQSASLFRFAQAPASSANRRRIVSGGECLEEKLVSEIKLRSRDQKRRDWEEQRGQQNKKDAGVEPGPFERSGSHPRKDVTYEYTFHTHTHIRTMHNPRAHTRRNGDTHRRFFLPPFVSA